jgi:hypothetical protein
LNFSVVKSVFADKVTLKNPPRDVAEKKRPELFQRFGSAPDICKFTIEPLWSEHWAETLLTFVSLIVGKTDLDADMGII